ncbi:hypothetical protein LCGC14_2044210 [marine sediment metagenome]|uniref:Uncharacterized protein n=1 Tax=marine sediment metagenome TaxID=412755 RepID=A0A0F9FDI4_9ZZZZ
MSVSSSSIGSCYPTKPKEEEKDAISCEDYYKLGSIAERNGLIEDAKKHFTAALKQANASKVDDMKSIIRARLNHFDTVIYPSDPSNVINLSNISILDDKKLKPFLHKNLTKLILNGCPSITKSSVRIIGEKCLELQILALRECSNISSITGGLLLKLAIFRKLEHLDISDCQNLKILGLIAPHLKILKAYNDKDLEILDLKAPLSVKIEAENAVKIKAETLEKLFGIEKLIRIAQQLDSNYCKFILKLFYPSMKDVILNADIKGIIPGERLIKTLLDRIDKKEEFIEELKTADSLSEVKLTVSEADKITDYPMSFGTTLQFVYDPKKTSKRDLPLLRKFPIEATILLVAKALETNAVVSKLDLSSCMIGKSVGVLEHPFKNNYTITHLDLSDNNIGAEFMFLANVLKDTPLKYLNLRSNRITAKGIAALAAFLITNRTMTHLDLSENNLGGNLLHENAISLGQAIGKNKSLTHLCLSGNKFNYSDAKALAKQPLTSSSLAKNSSLTHLDLSANEIGFFGLCLFLQGLETNQALTHLDLSSNQIECNATKRIEILKNNLKNNAIVMLDLSENKITADVQKALKRLEESKPNLQVKTTFGEFVEKTLDSLKEEFSDSED